MTMQATSPQSTPATAQVPQRSGSDSVNSLNSNASALQGQDDLGGLLAGLLSEGSNTKLSVQNAPKRSSTVSADVDIIESAEGNPKLQLQVQVHNKQVAIETDLPDSLTQALIDGAVSLHELKVKLQERIKTLTELIATIQEYSEKELVEKCNQMIEEIKKQEKNATLNSFLKVLGYLGVAVTVLLAIAAPSPMTIALAMATVVMVVEPMISQAAGKESMIQKTTELISKGLQQLGLNEVAAQVIAYMVVVVATILVSRGAVGACASASRLAGLASGAAATADTAQAGATATIQKLRFGMKATLGSLQVANMTAQGTLMVVIGTLKIEIAKMLYEIEVSQALIAQLDQLIQQLMSGQAGLVDLVQYIQSAQRDV